MNRRDFIKQSAVVAVGIAAGAKVLPVADSWFPGVMGVDKATSGSEDFSAIAVAWHDKTGEIYHLESFVIDRPPFDYYHIAREWNLSLAEVQVLSDREKAEMGTYTYYRSILEEADRQTSWGQMVQDGIEEALTQEEGGFMEALG